MNTNKYDYPTLQKIYKYKNTKYGKKRRARKARDYYLGSNISNNCYDG